MSRRIADRFREEGRLIILAFSVFLIHAVTNWLGVYNYFCDEFYHVACSDHLAWGHADQPSLSIASLRLHRGVIGDSLFRLALSNRARRWGRSST